MDKLYSFAFYDHIERPYANYYANKVHFYIPTKDAHYFKENIPSFLDIVFYRGSKNPGFKDFPAMYFDSLIKTTLNYSPEFLSRLKKEIFTLSPSQVELFLEYNRYNQLFAKKANPLFDIQRIKKGLLTKKIISTHTNSACLETYHGFIRVLESGNAKIITLKVDGKDKTLLVKSFSGVGKNNIREGTYTLALDPKNFKIYSFNNFPDYKERFDIPKGIRVGNNKMLVDNFTDFEFAKKLFFDPASVSSVKIASKDILIQVSRIKELLKNYVPSKQKTKIASFKTSVKKMLKDKETRDLIKKRFRK